jgi:hypothetical protein
VFAHHSRHRSPISGSVKYRVLHPRPGPLQVLRCGLLLSKPRTSGPWRWQPSSPETRAAQTTSPTCRPSASAATPASATAVCLRKRAHRLPRPAGQLRPPRSGLCVLRAGGQRPGAAGERGAQPGDPASSWGRRSGAAEDVAAHAGFPMPPGARTYASTGQATPIQERCCQRSGSWRPCRAITRISAPCSRK